MADEPSVHNVLVAIEKLASTRRVEYATRVEIAYHLGVAAEDISRKGPPPTGPLGEAFEQGLIEEDTNYAGYWRLTAEGQGRLDSTMFNG